MEEKFEILENSLIQKDRTLFKAKQNKRIDLKKFDSISVSLQSLQLNIQQLTNYRKKTTIQFFSSIRQEGASTIAGHYAVLLAQSSMWRRNGTAHPESENRNRRDNGRILLIDANLRNPGLHKIFNIPNKTGLSELILEESHFADAVVSINDSNLDILPTGMQIENPTRIFESDALHPLMEKIRMVYSIIIIDSAPIVPYSDGLAFANYVDGAALVIQASKTRREIIESAQKKLHHAGIKVLGVVLNKRQYYIPRLIYQYL